jgi:hypothetical protein
LIFWLNFGHHWQMPPIPLFFHFQQIAMNYKNVRKISTMELVWHISASQVSTSYMNNIVHSRSSYRPSTVRGCLANVPSSYWALLGKLIITSIQLVVWSN